MIKTGIMGGTFDPVHKGHIELAIRALFEYGLDEVMFLPAHINWIKQDMKRTKDIDRVNMLRLAIESTDKENKDVRGRFKIDTTEISAGGYTYTKDTLLYFRKKFPDNEFYFIMGADSLKTLPTWVEPDIILANAVILAAARGDKGEEDIKKSADSITERFGGKIMILHMDKKDISSSDIRSAIEKNGYDEAKERFKEYLVKEVFEYMKEKELYIDKEILPFNTARDDIKQIRKGIKEDLDKKRYEHTLGVAYTAASLAMAHMSDIEDAYVAGLLHDCAKYLPGEEKLKRAKENNITINEAAMKNPDLLHAELGAILAKEKYGINDEDILNAIRFHTTGRKEMSLLEKIIYIADYIEPNRKDIPGLSKARSIAFKDINAAMAFVSGNVLKHLKDIDAMIDELTIECNEFYSVTK